MATTNPAPPCGAVGDYREPASPHSSPRVAFLFLGRRGFSQFAVELAEAAAACDGLEPLMAVARGSEVAGRLGGCGVPVLKLDTFDKRPLPDLLTNFRSSRRALLARLAVERPAAVVTLMPHVWTPLLAPAIRRLGIRYITIVHDADPHPGDPTGFLTPWLLRDARHADVVVTLGQTVAGRLVSARGLQAERVVSLFHPDLRYGHMPSARRRSAGDPLRLLSFGRILKYKGLPLLIDAVERLRAEGLRIELGIAGAGELGDLRPRLAALGAEVINRWIDDQEVGPLLERYDAVALSHIEASQSGVAAAAFGSCMPVVALPTGGLVEQVVNGRTGILAKEASAGSLAEAIGTLARDPALYTAISATLADTAGERSMGRFVSALAGVAARSAAVSGSTVS